MAAGRPDRLRFGIVHPNTVRQIAKPQAILTRVACSALVAMMHEC
jgi:hypothetical protein